VTRPDGVSDLEWAAWRRWLETLSPEGRYEYDARWEVLDDDERRAAVRWGGVKLRRLREPSA
jgi:hypothetical protein